LLLTPEETSPPPIATRANALGAQLASAGDDGDDALLAIHDDANLRAWHADHLPVARPRVRGLIDPDRAVAEAKLMDARDVAEAARWLKPRERLVVLQDRALIEMLAQLPARSPNEVEAAH
jgi:membrane glycosyltransferase